MVRNCAQLYSDLHQVFVAFQESLCRIDENPFDVNQGLRSLCLTALSKYRDVFSEHIALEDDPFLVEARSLICLYETFVLLKQNGSSSPVLLESWIDQTFPVNVDIEQVPVDSVEFWKALFRFLMRKRFESVIHLLQRIRPALPQVDILIDLLLVYPTAQQRSLNPYALTTWILDADSRLRVENVASWHPNLRLTIEYLKGEAIPIDLCWQELLVGSILLSPKGKVIAEEAVHLIKAHPSSCPEIDKASVLVFKGKTKTDAFIEAIATIPIAGPHLIDVVSRFVQIPGVRETVLISHADSIMTHCPSFWNLTADYYWAASTGGQKKLEVLLFELAANSKSSLHRESIIDMCHNFDLEVLAAAIHVLISKEALAEQNHPKALLHAIQANQVQLINSVCDAALQEFFQSRSLEALEIVDDDSIDTGRFPRLFLLLKIKRLQELIDADLFDEAIQLLVEEVLPLDLPIYLRPNLLELFVILMPKQSSLVLRRDSFESLLRYLNEHSDLLSLDHQRSLRLFINQQATLMFLNF